MAKAKKTKSGAWRVRVFDHEEIVMAPDGTMKRKKIVKSFTVNDPSPAGKREAERQAAEWAARKIDGVVLSGRTVADAVEGYINMKAGILSPTTVRSYRAYLRNNFAPIRKKRLASINRQELQAWVNGLAADHSPKSVKNIWGLFTAALDAYEPGRRVSVNLPMKKPPKLYTPSDEDVRALIEHTRGTDMERAILLAAFGTLRRSELCALTSDDISGNTIQVNKAAVYGEGDVVIKSPKTSSSYRVVALPEAVIRRFDGIKGRLVDLNPNTVSKRFKEIVKECGLHPFRFHDLRSYSVSSLHALGIPDAYLMERGGWQSDRVLKEVYRRTIDQERERFNAAISDHFGQLVDFSVDSE